MIAKQKGSDRPRYSKLSDIEGLFASSKDEIEQQFEEALARLKDDIAAIIAVDSERTFYATFKALDKALEGIGLYAILERYTSKKRQYHV